MKRWLSLFIFLVVPTVGMASEQPFLSKFSLKALADVQLSANEGLDSWLRRGGGKFRFDETDNGKLRTGVTGVTASYALSTTTKLHTTLQYNDDPGEDLVLTEAFWHYRPVPRSTWRGEYKAGVFHGPFSLENSGPLWTSPFSLSPSVINSWFGEELRTLGAETTWSWRENPRSPHKIGLTAGLFMGNDTAGLLLSWRGWSNTDRQTGIGERLPLRNLPNLAAGGLFEEQSPWVEPFLELDNRPGFYLGADWKYKRYLEVALHYYDNQADSSKFEDGQYGWRTEFTQLSLSWRISNRTRLLSQYLSGSTKMNSMIVKNDFSSGYLTLSHSINNHRFTGRWETFRVDDNDATPMDNNLDDGHSLTLAYAYRFSKNWKLTLEGIRQQSEREGRRYFNEPEKITEDRLVFSARYYL